MKRLKMTFLRIQSRKVAGLLQGVEQYQRSGNFFDQIDLAFPVSRHVEDHVARAEFRVSDGVGRRIRSSEEF